MRKPREWTDKEYQTIIFLREQKKCKWPEIARVVDDSVVNTIGAYRRAVGAKHSSYKDRVEQPVKQSPRILVFDVETLPMVCFTWGMYDQTVHTEQVIQDVSLLGWAGKFLNDAEMFSDILSPEEAIARDASRIVKSAWDLLSQADVVIGHNFQSYDQKVLHTEFLKYGLPPLKYITVDTYLVAKANFRFSSNKLAFINKTLGMRDKLDTGGFELWRRCHEGDPDALGIMRDYNIGDIYSTEELFYRVRPYVRNVNVALYNEATTWQCPVCGGVNLAIEGNYYTSAGKWLSVRCGDCGCLSRAKDNLLTKEKRKSLLINS